MHELKARILQFPAPQSCSVLSEQLLFFHCRVVQEIVGEPMDGSMANELHVVEHTEGWLHYAEEINGQGVA